MKTNRCRFFQLLLIVCALFLFKTALTAQTGSYFNQRDDQYTLLGLKRAKEAFDYAKSEFERTKEMYNKQLISKQQFDRARNIFADAEVNYQQSLLAVLFEGQHVSVQNAVKYQADDGRKHVKITLANTSGGGAEFKKLVNIDEHLFKTLQPDIINDVYVSLLNSDGAIISQPYEAKIEQLQFTKPQVIDFILLQDLDAVTVNITYGRGSVSSPKIFLQKDASVDKVIVQSEQFSQEAELGKTATLDLTLELFSGTTNTFKLEVVNLPKQINRYFIDPVTNARLSQFKFTESTNTRKAALVVSLPDRLTDDIEIDKPITFFVLVIPRNQSAKLRDIQQTQWTQQAIDSLDVGYVRLELVPRGIGKLLVRAQQLYYSIKADESVHMNIELINEGSRRLDNVEIQVDTPLNWEKSIEPHYISSLNIREENKVELLFTPPHNVSVGRYEFRVRTTSISNNQPVSGEDKSVIVEIKPETNFAGTMLIIALILGITTGIVVFGVRLSRK